MSRARDDEGRREQRRDGERAAQVHTERLARFAHGLALTGHAGRKPPEQALSKSEAARAGSALPSNTILPRCAHAIATPCVQPASSAVAAATSSRYVPMPSSSMRARF